ncbi:hypothetical protein JSQ81_11480 [Sporosarcina sp. Marseille-Q4063]|uniref:hypothetical protein n=1 Tax=Sporosarcina sp. Marseille-Q4063 TaxID=2810514 RepID=UPI001BB0AE77|nr:hypothetical protein [Sporosarcina sp. Marseille-Q4063]QUW20482.1 hypothetical protein JSQ81_11480 [Sporosarcina sp. Marseille-Q4063]
MRAHWKFPSAGGGNISGLNETGITQFKSLPIQSVTKETLQDSLDAKATKDKPSIVKFSVLSVPRKDIPDIEGLTKIFNLGEQYWHHHEEAKDFFANGKKVLEDSNISIMAIQDYNTTGLSNIGGSKSGSNSGGWVALVRSTGITEKGPDASGSFGIGKHAPFAASQLQTVIYGTMNEEDEIGFQGVSKIASFRDFDGEITQGTGYFGYTETRDFIPITNSQFVPEPFKRSERGTDKFIIGLVEEKDWSIEVLTEAVSSFMLAILDEKLEVHIDDFILTKDTLAEAIKKIEKHDPNNLSIEFYQALTSSKSRKIEGTFKTDDDKDEIIELRLLASKGFKKRVVLYRGTGMKIYDRGHFRTPIEFAGVLTVKGERLNAVLRKMEPPTHDKWDPNLFKENTRYAKRLHKEINAWLNEQTRNLIDVSDIESVELKGLEKLLPDVTKKESSIVELEQKQIKLKTGKIKRHKQRKVAPRKKGLDGGNDEDGIASPNNKPSGTETTGGGTDNKQIPNIPKARISRARAFCTDSVNGKYTIRFWPSSDGTRTFSIKSVGENNNRNDIDIMNAKFSTGESISLKDNLIGPINFTSKAMLDVHIQLKTQNKLALEVQAN